jgi:hypothetical protein
MSQARPLGPIRTGTRISNTRFASHSDVAGALRCRCASAPRTRRHRSRPGSGDSPHLACGPLALPTSRAYYFFGVGPAPPPEDTNPMTRIKCLKRKHCVKCDTRYCPENKRSVTCPDCLHEAMVTELCPALAALSFPAPKREKVPHYPVGPLPQWGRSRSFTFRFPLFSTRKDEALLT